MSITAVLQASSLSEQSKLNALTLYAMLRPVINGPFGSFLHYLTGPARGDVVTFLETVQAAKLPVNMQALMLAQYLEFQEQGMQVTLLQYSDSLAKQLTTNALHQEQDQFVQRVAESKPPEPTIPQAGLANGWNNVQTPPPGMQTATQMAAPVNQMPVSQAIAPFDAGVVPMEDFAPDPAAMAAERNAVMNPDQEALPTAWTAATSAAATEGKQEVDIPQPEPLPDWVKVGQRVTYEMGDQKILSTITATAARNVTIMSDPGQVYHAVATAFLLPSTEGYLLEDVVSANKLADIEERKSKVISPQIPLGSCLATVAQFVRPSPVDGSQLFISVELAVCDNAKRMAFSLAIKNHAYDDVVRINSEELLPEWNAEYGGATYKVVLAMATPEPEEAEEAEETGPAKKKAAKKVVKKAAKKATPKAVT